MNSHILSLFPLLTPVPFISVFPRVSDKLYKLDFLQHTAYMLYNVFMRAREVIEKLKANGWKELRQNGSHKQFGKNGNVVTIPDHGTKDLKKGTVKGIEKSTGVELLPRPKKKKNKEDKK